MSKTTTTPTSLNQQIMQFGFNPTQAKGIIEQSTAHQEIQRVKDIAAAYERIAAQDQVARYRDWLAGFLPAVEELPELPEIGELPELPTSQPPTKPPKKKKATSAPAPDNAKRYYDGQTPLSSTTGRKLLWVQSSNVGKDGSRYVNVGTPRMSCGATVEDWEEILTVHVSRLLAEIRKLG